MTRVSLSSRFLPYALHATNKFITLAQIALISFVPLLTVVCLQMLIRTLTEGRAFDVALVPPECAHIILHGHFRILSFYQMIYLLL